MGRLALRIRLRLSIAVLCTVVLGTGVLGVQLHRPGSPSGEAIGEQDQLVPNLASSTGTCGVERWAVKTGTDADAGLVNLGSVVPTTISTMIGYPRPGSLPAYNRVAPQETTVYSIDATLTEYKLETDSDYHLVIQDGSGNTMITEIPDPACASGSRFLGSIQSARNEFDARYTPTGSFKFANIAVRVRGIGFFDYLHGQTGVAPNGIELHPVLDVLFNPPPPTPIVSSVAPAAGPAAGGTTVTITGSNFTGATAVSFGSVAASSFNVVDDSTVTAITPAQTVTTVDVRVTGPSGTSAALVADQFTYTGLTSYFQWFDMASPGMVGDNVHLLNTSTSAASVTVTLPGARAINVALAAGAETHVSFGTGHIGGPVVVNSDQAILASQRVQYFQTFNEVWAMTASQAATASYFQWFDRASPGMVGDNIHVLNPGTSTANVTVSLGANGPLALSLPPGAEGHVAFPAGTIGGPVRVSSSQPVLASQRVQYYQSFNEVLAESATQAVPVSYFQWFDKATPGMVGDNIHILNPGVVAASVTVTLPSGETPLVSPVPAGGEVHLSFPVGTIDGPVKVTSDQPVLASQRVQYYQTFNEVPAADPSTAATIEHVMWFDRATPGMVGDNIHLLNPGGTDANVSITVAGVGTPIAKTVPARGEVHVAFPVGTIGGPVTVTSDQPILASQRVQYYSSFNEIQAT